jgi:hypothetical protein
MVSRTPQRILGRRKQGRRKLDVSRFQGRRLGQVFRKHALLRFETRVKRDNLVGVARARLGRATCGR